MRDDRRRSRRKLAIAGCAALVVVAGLGWALWERRLELFVIPAQWERVLSAVERVLAEESIDANRDREAAGRECRRLVELQGLDVAPTKTLVAVERLRTLRGEPGFLLAWDDGTQRELTSDFLAYGMSGGRWTVVALDSKGRRVGAPLVFGRDESRNHYSGFIEGLFVWGTTTDGARDRLQTPSFPSFDVAVDDRGIVPLGFFTGWHDTGGTASGVPVSRCSSAHALHWTRDVSDTRLETPAQVTTLLESPWTGDLYRALYAIERLGPEHFRRALPLLEHDDDAVRARAVAVVGNDPSTGAELTLRLDDASELVRRAARVALLNSDDVSLARHVFLALLHGDVLDWQLLTGTPFDVTRLSSPEVAQAVVDGVVTALSSRGFQGVFREDLAPLLAGLRPADVGSSERVCAMLTRPDDESPLTLATIRLVIAIGDAPAVTWLRESLQGESLAEDWARFTLETLAERETPLPELFESLRAVAAERDSRELSLLAQLILTRWDAPGALKELIAGLREPDGGWLAHWKRNERRGAPMHPRSAEEALDSGVAGAMRMFGEYLFVDDSVPSLLSELGPPEVIPVLLESAADAKADGVQAQLEICREFRPERIRAVADDLLALWPRLRRESWIWYDVAFVFARAEDPGLDRLLVDIAGDLESPRGLRLAVLAAMLHAERRPLDAAGIEVLRAIAATSTTLAASEASSPVDSSSFDSSFAAGGDPRDPSSPLDPLPLDAAPALAASLLLMQWNDPGADERFLERARSPGATWLLDAACRRAIPVRLRSAVRAIVESDRARYGDVDWDLWDDAMAR